MKPFLILALWVDHLAVMLRGAFNSSGQGWGGGVTLWIFGNQLCAIPLMRSHLHLSEPIFGGPKCWQGWQQVVWHVVEWYDTKSAHLVTLPTSCQVQVYAGGGGGVVEVKYTGVMVGNASGVIHWCYTGKHFGGQLVWGGGGWVKYTGVMVGNASEGVIHWCYTGKRFGGQL